MPFVRDVTNSSLRVSWAPGPPGRLPLTAFRLLYAPAAAAGAGAGAGAAEWQVHEVSAGVTEVHLKGLVCGTLYKLAVEGMWIICCVRLPGVTLIWCCVTYVGEGLLKSDASL